MGPMSASGTLLSGYRPDSVCYLGEHCSVSECPLHCQHVATSLADHYCSWEGWRALMITCLVRATLLATEWLLSITVCTGYMAGGVDVLITVALACQLHVEQLVQDNNISLPKQSVQFHQPYITHQAASLFFLQFAVCLGVYFYKHILIKLALVHDMDM